MAPIHYGIWGKPTSTLDWCEENYVVTQFIAEFWNTISNWIMIIPPIMAAYLSWKNKLEIRTVASFLSIGLVGIGSMGFHCTLIYKMQLMDELPMIYGTCVLLYSMIELNSKENKMNKPLIAFFIVISFLVTMIYILVLNPLFFQILFLMAFSAIERQAFNLKYSKDSEICYAILVAWLFGLTVYTCKKYQGLMPLVVVSVASYGFGFILWNIDNNFCPQVRLARATLPGIVRPITQLHAWWHTLAGLGVYLSVIYSAQLRLKCLGYKPVLKVYYKFLPIIQRDKAVARQRKFETRSNNNNNINGRDVANGDRVSFTNGNPVRMK